MLFGIIGNDECLRKALDDEYDKEQCSLNTEAEEIVRARDGKGG